MNLRSVAAACALTVGLSASPESAVTAQEHDASSESALSRLQHEKMLDYVRARGGLVAPPSIDAYVPRIKTPEVKALLERTSSQRLPTLTANDRLREQALGTVYRTMLANGSECCPCTSASTCGDGLFCNGAELCVSGGCAPGPPACNDNNSCTSDSCTEVTDSCSHFPPPPPTVARLDLSRPAPASTVATLAWTPVAGASAYNIYRSASSNLGGLSCFQSNVAGTTQNDDGVRPAVAFYFLVSSLACSESGLGDGSSTSRPPPPGCP